MHSSEQQLGLGCCTVWGRGAVDIGVSHQVIFSVIVLGMHGL